MNSNFLKVICVQNCYGTISYSSGTFFRVNDVYYVDKGDMTNQGINIYDEAGEFMGLVRFKNFVTLDEWRDLQIDNILNG